MKTTCYEGADDARDKKHSRDDVRKIPLIEEPQKLISVRHVLDNTLLSASFPLKPV